MIRHIVFFTLRHDGDLETVREGLGILTGIPHSDRLEIGVNRKSDPSSKEVDVVVYGEFADDAALAAYKAHDLYAESIRRVKPLREIRLAADFDAASALCGARD
ncbi:Dabb family protein [Microbulbifer sp. S227A]|uniref:Dabb family protein n=1 Tax=Microbulbifer sp. S227A TaxID=3415131 RepID=UPI003C799982